MNVRQSFPALLGMCLIGSNVGSTDARAQQAQAVPVVHVQGTSHAFLVLREGSGKILGWGELLQLVHGDRVKSRLTYHFREGSINDDMTFFSQRAAFHLISDHRVQHGPFFSKATDSTVEETGSVTIPTVDKDGKEKVETSHIDLPPNVPVKPLETLGLVAPTGKGWLIQLAVDVAGEEPFSPILGVRRKATVFRVHPELGGVAGVVAPVIGSSQRMCSSGFWKGRCPVLSARSVHLRKVCLLSA